MLIRCKEIAEQQLDNMKKYIWTTRIEIIRVDGDPASEKYVNNKVKKCAERGIESKITLLPNDCTQEDLLTAIKQANVNRSITGILLQLPIPKHLDAEEAINTIRPNKDVDCLTKANIGKLFDGDHTLAPCTPKGIMEIFRYHNVDLEGKDVLIINRSMLVGKPLAELMLGANATVTIAHSKTKHLKEKMLNADIIVTAVGQSNFIDKELLDHMELKGVYTKKKKYIIDVSINVGEDGRLCGDVIRDDDYVDGLGCVFVTSVPGGVGLTTVSSLLANSSYLTGNR